MLYNYIYRRTSLFHDQCVEEYFIACHKQLSSLVKRVLRELRKSYYKHSKVSCLESQTQLQWLPSSWQDKIETKQ